MEEVTEQIYGSQDSGFHNEFNFIVCQEQSTKQDGCPYSVIV